MSNTNPTTFVPATAAARRTRTPQEHGIGKLHVFFVALPLLALLAGAASMWHFVSFAIMSNPILNGLIIAVLCWGMWTMVGHIMELFAEDRVFRAGMRWLQEADASGEQHPRLGPPAFVTGMLDRLEKHGLGHQVYIHSSAMEPEIDALEHYLTRRQELSQFLVGLMVGLGLLGTFVGLLETLVETSGLIATIAKGSGGGGDMESEFVKIVGGLQKPLEAMGTAFSASMFGLVGSIVLGFQMVAVRKAATEFVEMVRDQVLSLAENSGVNEKVEISERFLATLLADLLEQHRASSAGLCSVVARLDELVPQVARIAGESAKLSNRIQSQEAVLERATATVGSLSDVLPTLPRLASAAELMFEESASVNQRLASLLELLPKQEALADHIRQTLAGADRVERKITALTMANLGLKGEVMHQAALIKRMDSALWSVGTGQLRKTQADVEEPRA